MTDRCDVEGSTHRVDPARIRARPSDSRRYSGLATDSHRSTQSGRPSVSGTVACRQRRRGCWKTDEAVERRRTVGRERRDDVVGCDSVRRD